MKNSTFTETALVVETAPSWVPWVTFGILALAILATLGLRTTQEALAQNSLIERSQIESSLLKVQLAPIGAPLVEAGIGLPDQATRS
ncbi:MAG: hypothetical protein GY930_08515 [bacterium]|nr:hypothetical protein [bacterium]